jgi:hypothetical protein
MQHTEFHQEVHDAALVTRSCLMYCWDFGAINYEADL